MARAKWVYVALGAAWVTYGGYFLLPVAGPAPWGPPDSRMTGAEVFPACFVTPLLWPAAAGHVLFWAGSALLAVGRGRWAAAAGLLAFALELVTAVMFWPASVGLYRKMLAIVILSVAAIAHTAGAKASD